MKDFNIHIKSLDACNVYINGNFVSLIDNKDTFVIDLKVYSNILIITKEPISNKKKVMLPYSIKLNFNDTVTTDCDYVTIVPYKNSEYDVILETCEVKHNKKPEKIYDDFADNYNIVVVNDGQSYVNIYQINVLKFSTTIPEITSVICEKVNNYIIIKGAHGAKYYLLVIDENGYLPVINTECDQLEQNAQTIKYLKKMNDIAKHACVFAFDLQTGTPLEKYYVYLNENAVYTESEKLIPYAFLEALKVNNYNLARNYLSDELNSKTTNQHLSQFFPNIKKIYYNAYFLKDNVINYTVLCDEYKNYDFYITNNKIIEIEECKIH